MEETSATGEPAAPEHVGVAMRALLGGSMAGMGLVATAMWVLRTLQVLGSAPLAPRPTDDIVNLVLAGWLGGALLGAAAAWSLMSPLASAYRRGAFAMVAGFATLLLAFVTAPVDRFFGRWGLLGLAALCAASFALLLRRHGRTRA